MLDKNIMTFIVHISFLSLESKMTINPARKAPIPSLLAKKFIILDKYSDFADVFLKKLAKILPKRTGINKHVIELEDGK